MKLRLFGSRLSPFTEKVARVLEYKNLDFEPVPIKSPSDFKKWNPTTGKMPVLEIDGEKIYDSTRIVRRINEIVSSPPLFSETPAIAHKQSFIEDWSDESFYWYTMALRWNDANAKATAQQILATMPSFVRPIAGLIIPRQIRGQAMAQGTCRLPLEVTLEELGRRFDELIALLDGQPFFYSDVVGLADIAIFGQLQTLRSGPTPQGVDLMDERPELGAFYERVAAATLAKPGAATKKQNAA